MRRLGLVSCIVVGLLAVPVSAAERGDGDDTSSRLDLRRLEVTAEPGGIGTIKVGTYGKWRSHFLRDANPTTLRLLFDDGDDGDVDLVGNFRFKGGALLLFLQSADGQSGYEPVPVRRANRRSVRARFPFDTAEFRGEDLAVWARVKDAASAGCREVVCSDRGPDVGGVNPY